MIENLKVRLWIVFIIFAMCLLWFAPNVVNLSSVSWLPQKKINYGLDIQGGLHIVMGVDIEGSLKEKTRRMAEDLHKFMTEKNVVGFGSVKAAEAEEPEIEVEVVSGNGSDISDFISENYAGVLQVLSTSDKKIVVHFLDTWLIRYKQEIISQSIETLRNRIDEFGVAEPSITAQGDDRILVQLPGIEDAKHAKDLINRTAKLDFMMVSEDSKAGELQQWIADAEKAGDYSLGKLSYSDYVKRLNEDLRDKLPEKTVVHFGLADNAKKMEAGKIPYLLRTDTGLTGEDLQDASIGFDEYGAPTVDLSFNPIGAKKFGDLTGNNVGKLMAIVLDKVVKSAPVIKTRIGNGRAQITLGSAGKDRQALLDEAKLISTALKAGALPASLQQLEERTVGPSLGKDSIDRGIKASLIGAILVIVFMVVWYKSFGLFANLALAFNILILLAVLTSLGATLTLPGIAGIALTVGMAVDANVIIFERIKEELQKGAQLQGAIREGFARAFSAIFDSNITTAATCVVLMYYGTGPVRGFAVSLIIGLAASMFTAIFVTRTFLDLFIGKMKMKLSI